MFCAADAPVPGGFAGLPQAGVAAVLRDKAGVVALFDQLPVVEDENLRVALDGLDRANGLLQARQAGTGAVRRFEDGQILAVFASSSAFRLALALASRALARAISGCVPCWMGTMSGKLMRRMRPRRQSQMRVMSAVASGVKTAAISMLLTMRVWL